MDPIVYIIDDNLVSEFATKMVLEQASISCKIYSFESAELGLTDLLDALERKENVPDILFLDINMPDMDGWDFLEKISTIAHAVKLPAIYTISNFSSQKMRDRAIQNKYVKGYIERPLTAHKIEEILSYQFKSLDR